MDQLDGDEEELAEEWARQAAEYLSPLEKYFSPPRLFRRLSFYICFPTKLESLEFQKGNSQEVRFAQIATRETWNFLRVLHVLIVI